MRTYITGDNHGAIFRFQNFAHLHSNPANMIILGDAGFNFFLDNRDDEQKDMLAKMPFTFYLVRGNHEVRPEDLPDIQEVYDEEVQGIVRYQPRWPQIKYLMDGGVYTIEGLRTLVIGGAYSIDKLYRLATGNHWFANEQLSEEERKAILDKVKIDSYYDLVLTHTCPLDWEPIDLFLQGIDQSTVDQSMEEWLQEVRDAIEWKYWLFGHFHEDRIERPGVEMFYNDIIELKEITQELDADREDLLVMVSHSPNYRKK